MLASSLVDHENENMTIPGSIQLCNALLNGEFDVSWAARWGDLPCELRAWIQRQDGLKICGRSVTSIPELFEVHALLAKKTPISEEDLGVSITDIILQVIARYYRLLSRATRDSSIEHLIVRGTAPVPLKCSRCESRLLDDPFPRYKKVDTERYVAHNLKRGCGSETCQADKGHGFAVPWDVKKPWVAPKTDPLKRPPLKAKWTDLLLLQGARAEKLPSVVQIICRACRDQSSIQTDADPRWTIETDPRYVCRKPRCTVCRRAGTTWCPVDLSISWLNQASISKMWKRKDKEGWSVNDMVQNPDRFFSKRRQDQRKARRKRNKRNIRFEP